MSLYKTFVLYNILIFPSALIKAKRPKKEKQYPFISEVAV